MVNFGFGVDDAETLLVADLSVFFGSLVDEEELLNENCDSLDLLFLPEDVSANVTFVAVALEVGVEVEPKVTALASLAAVFALVIELNPLLSVDENEAVPDEAGVEELPPKLNWLIGLLESEVGIELELVAVSPKLNSLPVVVVDVGFEDWVVLDFVSPNENPKEFVVFDVVEAAELVEFAVALDF